MRWNILNGLGIIFLVLAILIACLSIGEPNEIVIEKVDCYDESYNVINELTCDDETKFYHGIPEDLIFGIVTIFGASAFMFLLMGAFVKFFK